MNRFTQVFTALTIALLTACSGLSTNHSQSSISQNQISQNQNGQSGAYAKRLGEEYMGFVVGMIQGDSLTMLSPNKKACILAPNEPMNALAKRHLQGYLTADELLILDNLEVQYPKSDYLTADNFYPVKEVMSSDTKDKLAKIKALNLDKKVAQAVAVLLSKPDAKEQNKEAVFDAFYELANRRLKDCVGVQ
ncbi:hypothetical protein [Moraxella oblonga]|uniref:hypothetical protein n=1 Tax=Moraxella oblonga TaxID=200413 RepID=UPI00083754A2|nr:hypothetical protein [Moraxella oblonga]